MKDDFLKIHQNIYPHAEFSIEQTHKKYWKKIRHPFGGGFELTPNCNFKCVHCYMQDYKTEQLLSTEQVYHILNKLYEKGVFFLNFTGGEILTRKDFADIYLYAKKRGFIISLLTNATLINENIIDIFTQYPPANVSVSMYGKDEDTYRKVTNTTGNYDKLIYAINLLKSNNINFEIKFIIMKENHEDFYYIEKFANGLGVDFSFTFELFPTLEGDKCVFEHMIEDDDIVNFEANYEKTSRIWSVNLNKKNPYINLPQDEVPLYMCDIGTVSFLVDCKGYLNPCNKLRLDKFNLLDTEFDEGWNDFQNYKRVIAPKNYPCANCEDISICNPCPGHNKLYTSDINVPSSKVCSLTHKRAKEFAKEKYKKYIIEYKELLETENSNK